jgi:hypothetical protein
MPKRGISRNDQKEHVMHESADGKAQRAGFQALAERGLTVITNPARAAGPPHHPVLRVIAGGRA